VRPPASAVGTVHTSNVNRAARDQAALADALTTIEQFNSRLAAGKVALADHRRGPRDQAPLAGDRVRQLPDKAAVAATPTVRMSKALGLEVPLSILVRADEVIG
jgi:hypothetical protein